jgi:7-cyano-7-deazaguanine synthase
MKKAIVVLSGGQDSTTCLHIARKECEEVHAVTFNYNQLHQIEISAALKVAKMLGADSHEIVDIGNCLVSTSPLTDPAAKLEKYENAQQMDEVIGNRVEKTFVPMRNALFLTLAANRAVKHGARRIYTGVCEADNANYPDCTQRFIDRMEYMINQSLGIDDVDWKRHINLYTPLIHTSKKESVLYAYKHPELWKTLAYTHTSYDGMYPPTDMNHANVLRAQGFKEAGLPDPLVVRAHDEGLMDLPETANYSDQLVDETLFRLGTGL